jgi:hypothetical protein
MDAVYSIESRPGDAAAASLSGTEVKANRQHHGAQHHHPLLRPSSKAGFIFASTAVRNVASALQSIIDARLSLLAGTQRKQTGRFGA